MRVSLLALALAVAPMPIVGCSNDQHYGEPVPASLEIGRRAGKPPAVDTPVPSAPNGGAGPSAGATSPLATSAEASSFAPPSAGGAWPRGTVCGADAREVSALGDRVQWRIIEWDGSTESLTETLRDVTRTGDELVAAGYVRTPGGKGDAYTLADPTRDVTMTLFSGGHARLLTRCKDNGEHTTAAAERAGWITASVHRRIGRGVLASFKASDGDELYLRAQIDQVTARPDVSGLVEAAPGAFRNAPGAEPEAVIILTETPLLVEYRTGNATLVDTAIQMHQTRQRR